MSIARLGLFAVGIGVAMAVIALIAGAAFFFQHRESQRASAQTADAEFQRLRARFANQRPLLNMYERRSVSDVAGPQAEAPLHSFNTIIFDTRGGERIVRIRVPLSVCAPFRARPGLSLARRTDVFGGYGIRSRTNTTVARPSR